MLIYTKIQKFQNSGQFSLPWNTDYMNDSSDTTDAPVAAPVADLVEGADSRRVVTSRPKTSSNANIQNYTSSPRDEDRKKVVVLSEAPMRYHNKYQLSGEQEPSEKIPAELSGLRDKINTLLNTREKALNTDDYNILSLNMRDASQDMERFLNDLSPEEYESVTRFIEGGASIGDILSPEKTEAFHKNYAFYLDSRESLDRYNSASNLGNRENAIDSLYNVYSNHKLNPRVESPDTTFGTEAQNVKDFYARTDPNVDVEILNSYNDSTSISNITKNLLPKDDIVVMGHSGDRVIGLDNNMLSNIISKSMSGNCYMGSCSFEGEFTSDIYKKNLKGSSDFHYRPESAWLGFNPQANSFEKGMWGRYMVGEDGSEEYPNSLELSYSPKIVPLQEGKTHTTARKRSGGILYR